MLGGVEYMACIAARYIGHCDFTSNDKTHVGKSAGGLRSSPEAAKRPPNATLLCHTDIYGAFSCTNGYLVKGKRVLACILSVIAAVAVAMPLMRCMKFKAMRSATSIDRALPFTTPNLVPDLT